MLSEATGLGRRGVKIDREHCRDFRPEFAEE
jgi:hypothetical protein